MDEEDFDIGALLGGPVRAIQEAQIAAEREYMAFLLDYGLEEVTRKQGNTEIKSLRLRELAFGMSKSITDPSTGEVATREAEVRAPLISLVQMPAVGIKEATIELDLDVQTQVEEKDQPTRSPTTGRFLPATRIAAPAIKGTVANSASSRNFRTHGKLSVKMTLTSTHDDDLHGRLTRIIGDGVSALADVPE